jgi:hypothetical protein
MVGFVTGALTCTSEVSNASKALWPEAAEHNSAINNALRMQIILQKIERAQDA